MDPVVSRKCWRATEPVHAQVYFSPEAQEEYAAAGLDLAANPRAGYFPARVAALGAVATAVVVATFYSFAPATVEQGMAGVWDAVSPQDLLAARLRGADRALRRLRGDLLDRPEVAEAAELARTATEGCTPEGRPLYAAHAALPWPDAPHLRLFHAITLLREHRGDGHVAALVSEQVSGLEAGVMHVAQGDAWTREPLRTRRGWTTEQWDAACGALRARGWLDDEERFTDEGAAVRARIEQATDVLALPPWQHLGEQGCARLRELVRPLSQAVVDAGGIGIR